MNHLRASHEAQMVGAPLPRVWSPRGSWGTLRVEHELERVLIVADDASIREALAECVASLGIEVATSPDGRDGLAKLRGGGALPDAVLVDLGTGRLDGRSFVEALRADAATSGITVVALNAPRGARRPPVRAAVAAFDLDELAKILARLGRERRAA